MANPFERPPKRPEGEGEKMTCPRCGGSGRDGNSQCARCGGIGKISNRS